MNVMNNLPVLKPVKVVKNGTKETKSDKESERLRKVKERIIRNRASANASRLKKKIYMELLEKKNIELSKEKENLNNQVQKLQYENINLKLQMEYLNQTVKKMSNILCNQSNQQQILNQNVQLTNAYLSPLQEINYTIPENEPINTNNENVYSNIYYQPIIQKENNVQENIIPDNYLKTYSPQSSVGEPAALTNENSLQRTLFSQRINPQILTVMMYTNLSVPYVMMTIYLIQQAILFQYQNLMLKDRIQYKTSVISKPQNLCQHHLLPKFSVTKTNEIYSRYWNG